MVNRLLNDICRCRDDSCPLREKCLRWLDRDAKPEDGSWIPYAGSLRESGRCWRKIGLDGSTTTSAKEWE
jgi:hypothetical protein